MNIPTQETEEQKSKCITKGCRNYKHQGEFIGDLCAPCFLHITSGNVIPTESFVGDLQRELTAAQEELAEWSVLKGWGGTPEIINDFIKGQQTRIHYAQNIEEELTAVTEQRDRLVEALQGAQAALNPLSGFTKSQHQKHIDVVRDAIRAALEPFRQKP